MDAIEHLGDHGAQELITDRGPREAGETATMARPGAATGELLFCYGTLMFPEVMHAVTGRELAGRAGLLHGYARFLIRGEQYPAIVAHSGGAVRGTLYDGLGSKELRLLDRYEHDYYRRVPVMIELDDAVDAEAVRAWTYELAPGLRGRLAAEDWDREAFARLHLKFWLLNIRRRVIRSSARRRWR